MKNSNQNVYKDALRWIVRKQIYLSAPYHWETCFIFSLSHSVILEYKMEAIWLLDYMVHWSLTQLYHFSELISWMNCCKQNNPFTKAHKKNKILEKLCQYNNNKPQ